MNKAIQDLKRALEKLQSKISLPLEADSSAHCEIITNLIFYDENLKSIKRPLKVASAVLRRECSDEFGKCISKGLHRMVATPGGRISFASISFLLEDCPFTRNLLSAYVNPIIKQVSLNINAAVHDPISSNDDGSFCEALKAILQVIQFMKDDIAVCFGSSDNTTCIELIGISKRCISILLQIEIFSVAVRNMAGIVIGHLLNYEQQDENVARIIHNMSRIASTEYFPILEVCGPFAELGMHVQDISERCVNAYLVFLAKGLFSCTRPSVFTTCIVNQKTLLHVLFKPICHASDLQEELQYHSLQVLKLWWVKVQLAVKRKAKNDAILDISLADGFFVKTTIQILFKHWDSPISGTPSIVLEILNTLISIVGGEDDGFLEELLHKLMLLPASIKGKYNFISSLVSKLGSNFVLKKYPNFLNDLRPLLAVNHLCPVISKTYRTLVSEEAKNKTSEAWESILLPGLVETLLHSDALIRCNSVIYWLPVHLKCIPDAYSKILDAISDFSDRARVGKSGFKLLALMAVSKIARKENLINIGDIDHDLLKTCLTDFDDAIRCEAFSVVCCNTKSSEKISALEMNLIQTYLPFNMNSDSATFRQQLVFCIRCFTERMRDSINAATKKLGNSKGIPEESRYIEDCKKMFQSILDICVNSLHPMFTYQRKKTGLDIYCTLLNTLSNQDKENFVFKVLPEKRHALLLLEVLKDTVPEIRNLAETLLIKYFTHIPFAYLDKYTKQAYKLCGSPRSQDNESAAAMLDSIMKLTSPDNHTSMLNDFYDQLRKDFHLMSSDILKSSYEAPAHGWLLTLGRCLSSLETSGILEKCSALLNDICEITCSLIHFALKEVFGGIEEENSTFGTSADFCEMTERIEKLVIKDGEKGNKILLTDDHEAILASCWLCLLRGSSLLATIARIGVTNSSNEALLNNITKNLVLILTSCRHRGAIEGCFDSFLNTCTALLKSKHEFYRNIPRDIIRNICDGLQAQTKISSNVTRRSAGIPMVVEAILVAEVSSKKSDMFHSVMVDVITLSSQVQFLKVNENDENFDFPQIHGLYILKHIFRNSSLGSLVLNYAASVLDISIKCLSSPIWVARNAATHLFGAVVSRMLGQKNIDGSHLETLENSVSSNEFFSRYPALGEIIMEEVKKSLPANTLPEPGLHPTLCMLSKLTYCDNAGDCIPEGLSNIVQEFLASPVYSIRSMAARSILSLTKDAVALANSFLNNILECATHANVLHGRLLFVLQVVKNDKFAVTSESTFLILLNLWCTGHLHPINANVILEILMVSKKLFCKHSAVFIPIAKRRILSSKTQVEIDQYRYKLTEAVLYNLEPTEVMEFLAQCISSGKINAVEAAFDWIKNQEHGSDFLPLITNYIHSGNQDLHCAAVEVMNKFINIHTSLQDWNYSKDIDSLCERACEMVSQDSPLTMQCSGLKLLSFVLVVSISPNCCKTKASPAFAANALETWLQHVSSRTSLYKASEPLRLSAAESIDIAGCSVYELIHKEMPQLLGTFACAVLSLLHDEQRDVRRHVCSFITKLDETNGKSILCECTHHTVATKVFLSLFFTKATPHFEHIKELLETYAMQKTQEDALRNQCILFDKEPFNLYNEPQEVAKMAADAFEETVMKDGVGGEGIKQLLHDLIIDAYNSLQRREGNNNSFIHSIINLRFLATALRICERTGIEASNLHSAGFITLLKKLLQNDEQLHPLMNQEISSMIIYLGAND